MKRMFRILSYLLLAVYVGDLLGKKFFSGGFYAAWALPETAAYLFLFFAVGCFLFSIVRIES